MRPDSGQRQATAVAPGQESGAGARVGPPRVRVANVGGEEFDVAPARAIAGVGDQRRHQVSVGRGREGTEWDKGRKMISHGNLDNGVTFSRRNAA